MVSAIMLFVGGQSTDAKSGLAATAIALPLYWICMLTAVVLSTVSVRRFAAHEGAVPQKEQWGHLFEQWVGLELLKQIRLRGSFDQLCYWRDLDGPEVDWVIVQENKKCIPIEVKWAEQPTEKDLRHLHLFCELYNCTEGFIICRSAHRLKLSSKITAIPWQEIDSFIRWD